VTKIDDPTYRLDEMIADEVKRVFFGEKIVYVTPVTMGKTWVANNLGGGEFRYVFFVYIGIGNAITGAQHWTGIEIGGEMIGLPKDDLERIVKTGVEYAFEYNTKQRTDQLRQAMSNGAGADIDLSKFGQVPILGQGGTEDKKPE
jgi:hypothetical protein